MTPTTKLEPELPEPIGVIVGRRLTPENTREFWGYFAESYTGTKKERVYTEAQVLSAIAADRNKRDTVPDDGSLTALRDMLRGELDRVSAAPVSAGLSDDLIMDEARKAGFFNDESLAAEFPRGYAEAKRRTLAFARALSARLLPEGYAVLSQAVSDEQLDAFFETPRGEAYNRRCMQQAKAAIAAAPSEVQAEPREEG